MENNNQSDILTIDEAAALLKIPRSSVYKLAQQRKIPAKKIGRHWRFHRGVLLNYVAGISDCETAKFDTESIKLVETDQSIE